MAEFIMDNAIDKAKSIRAKLGLTDKIGLNVGDLVKYLQLECQKNIKIFKSDFKTFPLNPACSGFLRIKGNSISICINQNESIDRNRFTLLHEIGHFLLHYDGNSEKVYFETRRSDDKNRDEKELQADAFANELLMPANQIVRFFNIDQNIAVLAEIFEVSHIIMKLRLIDLKLI